jgi:carbonic anhydrase/acetyltransferase-like protein (isoleucine patch superfamily)
VSSVKSALIVVQTRPLSGMVTPVGQMIYSRESLFQRLHRQVSECFHSVEVMESESFSRLSSEQLLKFQWVFHDNQVFSNALIRKLFFGPKALIDKQNRAVKIETTFNHGFSSMSQVQRHTILGNAEPKTTIEQTIFFRVPVKFSVPSSRIKNLEVIFPSVFFHQVTVWPDFLVVSSLLAREFLVEQITKWKKFLPDIFLQKIISHPRSGKFSNRFGKNCKVHPSSVIESVQLGDNVEIGPHCYIRSSLIGSNTVIREGTSLHLSTVGADSFISTCDILNCYLGPQSMIATSQLYNSFIGSNTFIGGGTGFADVNMTGSNVQLKIEDKTFDSEHILLGSGVGENCFLGAGLLFQNGLMIPAYSQILNHNLISQIPQDTGKTFIHTNGKLLTLPKSFLSQRETQK